MLINLSEKEIQLLLKAVKARQLEIRSTKIDLDEQEEQCQNLTLILNAAMMGEKP